MFFGHFLRHICSAVKETIRVSSYATSFGAKNVQKTKFEAAEMIDDPWSQQHLQISGHERGHLAHTKIRDGQK